MLFELLDPSFQAFAQSILDTASLDVFSWVQLARVSHDMYVCVNRALAHATRAHIEGLLRLFPSTCSRQRERFSISFPVGKLIWARDLIDTDVGIRHTRLVRNGYHTAGQMFDPCHTLVACDVFDAHYCSYSYFIYLPILNPGLEIAVARIAFNDGVERLPKRRKLA